MSKPMGSLPSEPMEVMAADASESEAKVKGSRRLELKLKLKLNTYFDGGFGIRLTLLPVGMQLTKERGPHCRRQQLQKVAFLGQ